jgi:hypothetical protein
MGIHKCFRNLNGINPTSLDCLHSSSGLESKSRFYSLTSALLVSKCGYRVDAMLNALRIAFCILPGTLQSPII